MPKILFYGINYSPELTGIGKYTGEMAQWYSANGHDVTVLTAPPYYPEWSIHAGFPRFAFSDRLEERVRVLRCPLYVPSRPSDLSRILHLLSFSVSSCIGLFRLRKLTPDLIVYVVPTLFCSLQILLYARLKGARIVLHIQDFEIDALLGLRVGRWRTLTRLAHAVERWVLKRFDRVSTISSGMKKRALSKLGDDSNLILFPNWSETERFACAVRDSAFLDELGVAHGQRVVLYSGSMGEKQGLQLVLDAAACFVDSPDVVFLMVGHGSGRRLLEEQARHMGLENVLFRDLLPYEDLPVLLASANCHLVIQRRGVADAVLPSKLTNILAAGGNAVITADPETTLGEFCQEHPGIAVRAEPESVDSLVSAIRMALDMPVPNAVARDYAGSHLDKVSILSRFLSDVGV